ncbi:50S ribosomal protein L19 [Chloroflexota bacterium]
MSSDLLRSVEEQQQKGDLSVQSDLPDLRIGDDVQVHFRIVEGERERIQLVRGTVMRIRKGGGANANFTVRRIAAHGIGVERTFPLHSPRIERIEVRRHAHVRRAKLYFLRGRQGKAAHQAPADCLLPDTGGRSGEQCLI